MHFFIVDVFAEDRYQGNPLAVLVCDRERSTREMQQIAKEIHFSETTFVVAGGQNNSFDARIFTPDREVPFAGHPTLGTAFVIRELLGWTDADRINLNLGIGQIAVTFDQGRLFMEQKQPAFGPVISERNRVASMLNIYVEDLMPNFPVQVVSTGLESVIIPLKSLDATRRCSVRHDLYQQFLDDTFRAALLVFTTETLDRQNAVHVRVFVDDYGFFEDPATGSGNGNLAAYLVEYRYFGKSVLQYRAEQGYETGRPSLLEISAAKHDSNFTIRVGGRVIPIANGEWI